MGRGGYLGGGTIIRGGYGFTPLDDDLGYKPSPSKPTAKQKKAAIQSKKAKANFWKKKRKAKRGAPNAPRP